MAAYVPGIVGEYGIAADGPTILLAVTSPAAALWVKRLFLAMVEADGPVDLMSQPGVSLKGVSRLDLARLPSDMRGRLARGRRSADFVWSGNDGEWLTRAEMLDPFVCGQKGHQYLTSFQRDDAIIEISFGEYAFEPDTEPRLVAILV